MKANVGNADRLMRGAAGAGLIIWALLGGPIWAWIGIVPLATAVFRYCPAYAVFGLSACPSQAKS